MKLISMTDFVLKQADNCMFYDKVRNYAKFLKQPLELGMFIPCDENNTLLEEPENPKQSPESFKKYDEYVKAKERVLFEGFHILNGWLCYPNGNILCSILTTDDLLDLTIEWFLTHAKQSITLTETAKNRYSHETRSRKNV